jgi:hypothetical protein
MRNSDQDKARAHYQATSALNLRVADKAKLARVTRGYCP